MRLTIILFSVIALALAALCSALAREKMRLDNLFAPDRRRSGLPADPPVPISRYPNLAAGLVVDRANQLWVAVVTDIAMRGRPWYLAVIVDAHSHRLVGWETGETLAASLALGALQRALAVGSVQPGIVHHAERGEPYASGAYVALLEKYGFLISAGDAPQPSKLTRRKAAAG
jgi:transposase InsO family protein